MSNKQLLLELVLESHEITSWETLAFLFFTFLSLIFVFIFIFILSYFILFYLYFALWSHFTLPWVQSSL